MRCRRSPLRSGFAAAISPNYSPNPPALRPLVRVRPQPGRSAHIGIAAVARDCKHSNCGITPAAGGHRYRPLRLLGSA